MGTLSKIKIFLVATRAYSLPISIMSWFVPFLFGLFQKGSLIYGILALIGIVFLHLASNLFDDIIDYSRELSAIKKGKKKNFNFQKGKCKYIIENKMTLKNAFILDFFLFLIVIFIGIFFLFVFGCKLLYIIIPSIILCMLYPILGCKGFGEIIIGIIFSPLLYTGVYFVMTGNFSYKILILAISTGLLSVAILVNHSLLDYKYDTTNRKITLCSICKSEKSSLLLLSIIIILSYINLLFWIMNGNIGIIYLLPFFTLPIFFKLLKEMKLYIKIGKVANNEKIFLEKFLLAQNLQKYFIIMLCISIVLSHWFKI